MEQSKIAVRNRAMKKTLEAVFGRGKVRVRGSRGTGYGWVAVTIDYTPLDLDERHGLEGKCKDLLRAAKIDLGHSYTDDTCQYSSDQCHLNFNYVPLSADDADGGRHVSWATGVCQRF